MKKTAVVVFTICTVFLSYIPGNVIAQTTTLTPFYIHINPNYPQPYSSVLLSLSSNFISVTNSTFSVFVNNKKIGTGTGMQSVSFKTGAPGKSIIVLVKVLFHSKTYTQTLTLHPASVALAVEPLTTSPALYLGIPTIAAFGKVRLVAIPNMQISSKQIDPAKLSYTWKTDGETLPESGVGKTSIIVDAPLPYRKNTISVEVHDSQNTQTAKKSTALISNIPLIYIYINNPLTGVEYNHALSSNILIGSAESTFIAVPYGFSLVGGTPSIQWLLNGTEAQDGPLLTVRPKGTGTGVATISALVQKASTYENERARVSIQFGSNKGTFGLFGL